MDSCTPTAVPLDDISVDTAFQARSHLDRSWVHSLAQSMRDDPQGIPPVLLYQLPDERLVLVDGFHRLEAARALGWTEMRATMRTGTLTEALDAAAEANAQCLQRPLLRHEKKRLAIAMYQRHKEEFGPWGGQAEIERRLHIPNETVSRWIKAEEGRERLKIRHLTNLGHLPDSTVRQIAKAPPSTQEPLAHLAEQAGWTTAQTKEVVDLLDQVTTSTAEVPVAPEDAARLLDVARDQHWDLAQTRSTLEMTQDLVTESGVTPQQMVDDLASGTLAPPAPPTAPEPGPTPYQHQHPWRSAKMVTELVGRWHAHPVAPVGEMVGALRRAERDYLHQALPPVLDYLAQTLALVTQEQENPETTAEDESLTAASATW